MAWVVGVALAQSAVVQTVRVELPVGHVLRTGDLLPLSVPEHPLPPGTITDAQAVVGRSLRVAVFPGEVLRGEYLGETQTVPTSLIPEGHWLVPVDVRTDADDADVVLLYSGGFCVLARAVTVVMKDAGLVAIASADLPRALRGLGPDASVRRADPGLRDCR